MKSKTPKHTGDLTKLQIRYYNRPLVVDAVLPGDTYRVTRLSPKDGHQFAITVHVTQLMSWGIRKG